jgi:hypothetical protein
MKVYFCINESGLIHYIDHLRAAVRSSRQIGRLDPHILFDGDPTQLMEALGDYEVTIHRLQCSIAADIARTEETTGWYRGVAEGALLRLEIPIIETHDEYVLYCDCDTIFTREVALSSFKPRFFAAAPGHNPNIWNTICSGVLLINVKNMRAEYSGYMRYAAEHLGRPHYYDQEVLNEYFIGRIDRLPIEYHWKTYWGSNPLAFIVHFHGVKRLHLDWFNDQKKMSELKAAFPYILFENDGFKYYREIFDSISSDNSITFIKLILYNPGGITRLILRRVMKIIYIFTIENVPSDFDEEAYLYNNPDVAIGVYNGCIRSGWSHYRTFGRQEGRPGIPAK